MTQPTLAGSLAGRAPDDSLASVPAACEHTSPLTAALAAAARALAEGTTSVLVARVDSPPLDERDALCPRSLRGAHGRAATALSWRIPSPLPADRWAAMDVEPAAVDLAMAQRSTRHTSPITTIIYTHPSEEELYAGVRDLPC